MRGQRPLHRLDVAAPGGQSRLEERSGSAQILDAGELDDQRGTAGERGGIRGEVLGPPRRLDGRRGLVPHRCGSGGILPGGPRRVRRGAGGGLGPAARVGGVGPQRGQLLALLVGIQQLDALGPGGQVAVLAGQLALGGADAGEIVLGVGQRGGAAAGPAGDAVHGAGGPGQPVGGGAQHPAGVAAGDIGEPPCGAGFLLQGVQLLGVPVQALEALRDLGDVVGVDRWQGAGQQSGQLLGVQMLGQLRGAQLQQRDDQRLVLLPRHAVEQRHAQRRPILLSSLFEHPPPPPDRPDKLTPRQRMPPTQQLQPTAFSGLSGVIQVRITPLSPLNAGGGDSNHT